MSDEGVTAKLPPMANAQADELLALVKSVDRENPDPKDVAGLQRWLDEMPELWRAAGDVSRFIQQRLAQRLHGSKVGAMSTEKGLEVMRRELGHENSCQLEQLLIDHLLTCWLRLQDVELRYSATVGGRESLKLSQADWWERRLSAAQRRYLRACETLARVQKLIRRTPALQVNIATKGGQQINVAGDVQGARECAQEGAQGRRDQPLPSA